MIKSKSEPSLFPCSASSLQPHVDPALSSGGSAGGGHCFHRVPSLCNLKDAEFDTDAQASTPDAAGLTLPEHLLDVACVKSVVDAAAVFDVAHNLKPAHTQAAIQLRFSAVSDSNSAACSDHSSLPFGALLPSNDASAAISTPPRPLPPFITPSAPCTPTCVRASKGDAAPIPPCCLRLPWHLELPPVVHTFTLKTEHPGKAGTESQLLVLYFNSSAADEMLPTKRKEGIALVAATGVVVFDVFVAPPPAATTGLKLTSKALACARDAAYGPSPLTFVTPPLVFESRFQVQFLFALISCPLITPCSTVTPAPFTFFFHRQCGNLWRAVRVGEELYELLMNSDFNRRTKTCGFYFRVEGARKGARYRFRVVNFEKSDSLFKQGQRVLCYSCATEQWIRVGGSHVSYLPNNIHTLHAASYGQASYCDEISGGSECPQLYTLDFSFEPSRDGDTFYFAPSFPYSVRDNALHMASLQVPTASGSPWFMFVPVVVTIHLVFRAKSTCRYPASACPHALFLATSSPSQVHHPRLSKPRGTLFSSHFLQTQARSTQRLSRSSQRAFIPANLAHRGLCGAMRCIPIAANEAMPVASFSCTVLCVHSWLLHPQRSD
jgi:hypothetical protein